MRNSLAVAVILTATLVLPAAGGFAEEEEEKSLIPKNLVKRFEMESDHVAGMELVEKDIRKMIELGAEWWQFLKNDLELNRKFVQGAESRTPMHEILLGHSPYLEWVKEKGVEKGHWIKVYSRCRLTMAALSAPRSLERIDREIAKAVAELERRDTPADRIEEKKRAYERRYAFERAWEEMSIRVAPKLTDAEKKLIRKHGIALGKAVTNSVTEADLEQLDPTPEPDGDDGEDGGEEESE